jgi:hypothetical protein
MKMFGQRVAAVGLALGRLIAPVPPPSVAAGYVTIQLAHSAENLTDGCQPLPDVPTLETQAATYKSMGITGVTDTVVTSWVKQSTDTCRSTYEIASWDQITALQKTYGWTFVSGSRDYINLTQVSAAVAQSEICGSLTDIQQHGLTNGSGEFAFPNNRSNLSVEQIALGCGYEYGRVYSGGTNSVPVPSPYWLKTATVNGGACADPQLPCYGGATRFRYTDPSTLASYLAVGPGKWRVIQGYIFVSSAYQSGNVSWDCTGSDWRQHWTSGPLATEMYCWNDWVAVLGSAHGVRFVTPAQMTK